MTSKRILALLSAVLFACTCFPAAAEGADGGAARAYRALAQLLFDTDNVTVEMDAAFTYDGTAFKTVHGRLVQDGFNDRIDADYSTVRHSGASYDTHWKVHAVEGEVWYYDSYMGEYAGFTHAEPSCSVVDHNENEDLLISLAGSAMTLVDLALPGLSDIAETENGTCIRLSLMEGQVPAYLDTLTLMLIREAARRYMGIELTASFPAAEEDAYTGPEVWYEDDQALLRTVLRRQLGREVTEEELFALWDAEDPAMEQAYEAVDALVREAAQGLEGGYVYIRADGTCIPYATQEEMILGEDLRWIVYEDTTASFIRYMKETTGEELTAEDMTALYMSDNWELWEAYSSLLNDMEQHDLALLGAHPMGYMHADGTLEAVDDLDAFNQQDGSGESIAYDALQGMDEVRLGNSTLEICLDAAGRITDVKAFVSMDFVNADGSVHPVTMDLTAAATAYGESEVGVFDPAEWGLNDGAEQETVAEAQVDEPIVDIEELTLNGVTYDLFAD